MARFSVEVFTGNFLQHVRGEPMTGRFDGHANCFVESGDGKGLLIDLGDAPSAEATRRMTMGLGKESGDQEIVGWAHEMLAWFHLTAGNYRAVIAAAEAGIRVAPSRSVAVQLYGNRRKPTLAWACARRFTKRSKAVARCWINCPTRTDPNIIL